MAFDWRDFLLFAHELRNEPEESKQRTSIGRAYYYVYNVAKIEAKKLGFNENDPSLRKMGQHQRLWSWRQNQTDPFLVSLGDSGNTLKARRTRVDYYSLPSPPSLQTVQMQLDEARDFEILLAQIARTSVPPPLP
jgi:hypothetical protein